MLAAILILIFATTFLIASVAVTAGSFLLGRSGKDYWPGLISPKS